MDDYGRSFAYILAKIIPRRDSIFTTLNKVFVTDLARKLLIAILGIKTVMIYSRKKMYLLLFLFIVVKRAITVRRHEKEPPNDAEWFLLFYGMENGI